MRGLAITLSVGLLVAACGQTIEARCAEQHGAAGNAYDRCIWSAQSQVLSVPGTNIRARGGGQ